MLAKIKKNTMKNRKRLLKPLVFIVIIGSILISNSELENTRLVDIVQLVYWDVTWNSYFQSENNIWNKK